jgi:hypothetical protein
MKLKNENLKQTFFIDKITKKLTFKKDENSNTDRIDKFLIILKEQVRIFKEKNLNSQVENFEFYFNQTESGMKRLDEIFFDECKSIFPFSSISFSKEELKKYFEPLFNKLVKVGKKIYDLVANNIEFKFQNILFVGGATKYNLLREIIMEKLIIANEITANSYNPSLAVVYGTVVTDLKNIITNDLLGSS